MHIHTKPTLEFSRPSPGFTLIELLTVIAIIGILAAILIPVVGRVRSSAHAAHCVSNLRQIGTATFLYLNDNNDRFFPRVQGSRFHVLGKSGTSRPLAADQRPLNIYLGVDHPEDPVDVARCPEDAGSVILNGGGAQGVASAYAAFGSSLGANVWPIGLNDNNLNGVHVTEILDPTRFVMFAEDLALNIVFGASSANEGWHWDDSRFNLLFGDGHVGVHVILPNVRHTREYSFYRDPSAAPVAPTRPSR